MLSAAALRCCRCWFWTIARTSAGRIKCHNTPQPNTKPGNEAWPGRVQVSSCSAQSARCCSCCCSSGSTQSARCCSCWPGSAPGGGQLCHEQVRGLHVPHNTSNRRQTKEQQQQVKGVEAPATATLPPAPGQGAALG